METTINYGISIVLKFYLEVIFSNTRYREIYLVFYQYEKELLLDSHVFMLIILTLWYCRNSYWQDCWIELCCLRSFGDGPSNPNRGWQLCKLLQWTKKTGSPGECHNENHSSYKNYIRFKKSMQSFLPVLWMHFK